MQWFVAYGYISLAATIVGVLALVWIAISLHKMSKKEK